MTNRIWVQVADADRRVPREGQRGYLEKDVAHNVRNTPFVQRRIREGDLIKVEPPAAETPAPAATVAGAASVSGASSVTGSAAGSEAATASGAATVSGAPAATIKGA
jgi:hypothetical protein